MQLQHWHYRNADLLVLAEKSAYRFLKFEPTPCGLSALFPNC
jgi:hypothetical protein